MADHRPKRTAEPSIRDAKARTIGATSENDTTSTTVTYSINHSASESRSEMPPSLSTGSAQRRRFTEEGAPKKKPRIRRTQQLRRQLQLAQMIKEAEEAAARAPQDRHGSEGYPGNESGSANSATKVAMPNPILAVEAAPAKAPPVSSAPSGGRQIAVRGVWAEYATANQRTYWMNVVTKETTWLRPAGVQGSQDNQPRTGATLSRDAWASKSPNLYSGNHGHIFVGGLPPGMNDMVFKQSFERFGRLVSMSLHADRCYAYAQYGSMAEAARAVEVMHKSHFYGVRIMCKMANLDGIR